MAVASGRVSEAGMEVPWALAGGAGKSLPSRSLGAWSSLGQGSREAAYWQGAEPGPWPPATLVSGNSIGTHMCFWEETGTHPPQHLWVAGTL